MKGDNTMSITEDIADHDVITFDLTNFTVRKNDTEIEWEGQIPQIHPGSNIFEISL